MDKVNSLPFVGFSGKRLTEIITGGELLLDVCVVPFSLPQDRIPRGEKRKEKRIKLLMSDQDSGYLFMRDEKIVMLLFPMNLSERA